MQFIVLLGPKHSGKTSAGKALASLLSCDFIDLDDFIARRRGKSPRALYLEGPEIFRKAEAEALAALFESEKAENRTRETSSSSSAVEVSRSVVIASGGGIADNPEALALLQKNPGVISVFLDVSAKTAWERIGKERELPPFLRTENPEETHRSLHERRAAAYRQLASLVINADGKSPEEVAEEIKNEGKRFLKFGGHEA
jgi:shikimate kinase